MTTEFFEKYRHKIKTTPELLGIVGPFPRKKTVIICHGVFDVVHPGHVRHLAYAKTRADYLVVSITADRHIKKGTYRPHIPEELRALNLAAFEMVDFVIIDEEATPLENLASIQPDYFAKGFEYTSSGLPPATQAEAAVVATTLSKAQVKENILARFGGDLTWQKLQGQVYGKYIHLAQLFPGFMEFLCRTKLNGHSVFIISHKSEYGHFDNTEVNLRDAALGWMIDKGILGSGAFALINSNVFFESTRAAKISRILGLGCTHFIDDLQVILQDPLLPDNLEKILFDPHCSAEPQDRQNVAPSWRILSYGLFGDWNDDEVCRIAQNRFVSLQVNLATPKLGRGNSKIFELKSLGGKRYALKIYPDRQLDSRPRLETEFNATQFLEAADLPVAHTAAKDELLNWAAYSWAEGKSQVTVDETFVDESIIFVGHLRTTSRLAIDQNRFSSASEACMSGTEIIYQIQRKLTSLNLVTPPEVTSFLNHGLLPVFRSCDSESLRFWRPQFNRSGRWPIYFY